MHHDRVAWFALTAAAVAIAGAPPPRAVAPLTYDVYAVRYGAMRDFPLASLIAGADPRAAPTSR